MIRVSATPANKRVYFIAAAVLVGVPTVVIAGLFAAFMIDRLRVEAEADPCKALVPVLYDFKRRLGRFPSDDEADRIDRKLRTLCGYIGATERFSMSLDGRVNKFEAYTFDSGVGNWFWD